MNRALRGQRKTFFTFEAKKLLELSSAKLTALSIGLLLAVFCTIGMSFTPAEEGDNVGNPNDSTYVSGPRRSHWATSGWCGTDYHNATDYGKVVVSVVNGEGGTVSATGANATSETTDDNTTAVTITWNCGNSEDEDRSPTITALHTNTITFTAARADGYAFAGWYEDEACTVLKSGETTYSEPFKIDHDEYVNEDSKNTEYESTPQTWNRYAKFIEIIPVDLTFVAPGAGGQYTVTINEVSTVISSSNVTKNDVAAEVSLTADPASGYAFAGWYTMDDEGNVTNVSANSTYEKIFVADTKIGARFVPTTLPQFKNVTTNTTYYGLQAALITVEYGQTIIPVADSKIDGSDLFDGENYVIPTGVSLLIPYSDDHIKVQNENRDDYWEGSDDILTVEEGLAPFRTITLTEGVNIICNGTICIAGHVMSGGEGNAKSGYPAGPCGMIDMSAGGHIEMNDGSILYCWGMIKGQDRDQGNNSVGVGTITANRGSVIWEDFQVGDFRGGTACKNLYYGSEDYRFFPFQSYNICNIEVPITYKYGSVERCYTNLFASGGTNQTDFTLVGEESTLFLLQDENSLLRKWYDPTTDLMCYEMSGTTQLDAIQIYVIIVNINSGDFLLPIASNMKIIMTSNLTLSKPIAIHAGAELEIKEGANVTIDTEVYMFDNNEWDIWVKNTYFRILSGLSAHKYRGDGSDKSLLDDAKLIVDGTLTVSSNGKIYSTASGANIMGNGGGMIVFQSALPDASSVKMFKSTTIDDTHYDVVPMNAANLCNEDGSYTRSIASSTFHNVNGRWFVDGKQNEKADHTYDFTYIGTEDADEDGVMDNVETLAVYSKDKTGLEEGYKWANVAQDGLCSDNYNAAGSIIYNYTKNNAWTQFIPDERPNGYSGSDNKLYTKDGCVFTDPVAIDDETCLYPFTDGNKALVNGKFVALTPNAYDAAYKDADNKYYICFKGCNWHEATPYEGEFKTYNVVEGGTYIWFNSEWLAVQREDPFFYTEDAQTNVKTYYEYKDGEWIIALPYVTVTYGDEERNLFSLVDAFSIASTKKDAIITVNRDFKNECGPFTYAGASTTCTLDLNGHTVEMEVEGSGTAEIKMFTVNASGSTLTITDNSQTRSGELKLIANINTTTASKRWAGIYLANGTLVMERGKVYVENHFPHTSTSNTGIVSGVQIAGVGSERNFTMTGGHLEASARYSVCGVHGLEGNGAVITINGGTIDATAITSSTVYGILAYGTINVNGGTVNATSQKSTTVYGIYVNGSYNKDKSPKYYAGTCNLKGGTVNATAKTNTTAYGVYVTTSTSSSVYGKLYMEGGTLNVKATQKAYGILVNRANSYNSSEPRSITAQYPAFVDISGGEINVTTTSSNIAEGVSTYGTANISGGTFTINAKTSDAFGVRLYAGTTTISDSAYFDVQTPTKAYGVRISEEQPTNGGVVYNGTLIMNGGTMKVQTTTGTTAYGVYVGSHSRAQAQANDPNNSTYKSYYKGNYANAGTATINGGIFDVTVATNTAYALYVEAVHTQSGVTDKDPATATPKCTVNGGKFKVSGSSKLYAVNNAAIIDNFKVNGGYFNNKSSNASGTTLSTYIASPKAAIALTNASGNCPDENYPEYTHKVAEAYLVTFMNGEEQLRSTLQNAGVAAIYNGAEPRKDDDGDNSYEFDGWATTADGEVAYAKGVELPNVSAVATYYAHFATTAKKYIITWNANGGACATELTRVDATGSATVGTLPEATKAGYDFDGWFTATEGGNKITAETVVTEHVTYYAHYTVHSHTLTWDANGGAISGSYTHGSVNYGATITAPANNKVTRTGYTFAGWNTTPAATMPDNDLTYMARWTANTNTAYQVLHKKQKTDLSGYDTEETQNLSGTTAAWVSPDTRSYEGYKTPAKQTVQILANGSLVVTYLYDCITYDIAFDATTNGGTCAASPIENIVYGQTIGSRIASLPEEPEVSKEGNDFVGWFTKAVGGDRVTIETEVRYNIGTIYAQFRAKPLVEVGKDGDETFNVSNNSTVENVIVYAPGTLTVSSGRTLTTDDLVIKASPENSGEVIGNVVADNVYFDLTRGAGKVFKHHTWYAFSVPFQVNAAQILFDGQTMQYGQTSKKDDYDILYYDGSVRATSGKDASCWKYVEKDVPTYLYPGKLYMIANTRRDVTTLRFTKVAGTALLTTSVSVSNYSSANTADANWNGIANPAVFHANMDGLGTAQSIAWEYNPDYSEDSSVPYKKIFLNSQDIILGQAFFAQVPTPQTLVVEPSYSSPSPVRRRLRESHETDSHYQVLIAREGGESTDDVIIRMDENKEEDTYIIGTDLVRMGMSTKRPQMWVNRYNEKLCVNVMAPVNGQANYPLGIFAPADGEYEISIDNPQNDESMLYLTYDESAIWNLSYSGYTATLNQGTNEHYGLRIVAKSPQVATSIEEAVVDAQGGTRKVLINDKVYIIRGENVYSIDGQLVK